MRENKKGLTTLNVVMLALGTVVGGSFFLGSAVAVRTAGPAVIISYILGGALVYLILAALSEMTVAEPSPGSFRTYAESYFGPWLGFVVGWVYWTGLTLAMSSEAAAASIFIRGWFPEIPLGLIAAAIILVVTGLNLVGAQLFSRLEGGLAAFKLLALVGFIFIGVFLIFGFFPDRPAVGLGALEREAFLPGGVAGIGGSMLIVMFTYAGFEIVGLAAPETRDPQKVIPRAIIFTVLALVGLYLLVMLVLLPLIPTGTLTEEVSPFVMALNVRGLGAVGSFFSFIMITAILSTMLAATFSLGRMMHSLAREGHAPKWLTVGNSHSGYTREIIFSGVGMLGGVGLSYLLPQSVYLFLIASGGFSLLFAYVIILATHYRFRKRCGCPPNGVCRMPGYPYTSWLAFAAVFGIVISMPLVPGQGAGLQAGLVLTGFYFLLYFIVRRKFSRSFFENIYRNALFRLGNVKPAAKMGIKEKSFYKSGNKKRKK